jgi:hypothetical protein
MKQPPRDRDPGHPSRYAVPDISSVPTRGRTLDHAASVYVYDFVEPLIMLGKQAEYERDIR